MPAKKANKDSYKPTKPTLKIQATDLESTLSSATTAVSIDFSDTSCTTSSMKTRFTSSQGSAVPNQTPSKTITSTPSPDVLAVSELLGTMKRTLKTLGNTMTLLGKQTQRVEKLAPAIKANEQVAELRELLRAQMAEHDQKIRSLEIELEARVKEAIKDALRRQALVLVRESVAKRVQEAVAQQLKDRIPDELRRQARDHPRQILELKASTHNAEARAYNSALRSTTANLRPLLRPLRTDMVSPSAQAKSPSPSAEKTLPSTPSEIFPADLRALCSLSATDAKRLLDEYDIQNSSSLQSATASESPTSPLSASSAGTLVEIADTGNREQNINRFMVHIGLDFCLLPSSPSESAKSQGGGKAAFLIARI